MELKELIKLVQGTLLNNYQDVLINGFSVDTRTMKSDEVYIALRGKKMDGHKFINNDMKVSVVISEEDIVLDKIPVIKVNNTYDSLFFLGKYIRNKYNIPLIAITGSNGKTTLKELITNILSVKYKVLSSRGNNNNIIGVFKTLKELNDSYDIGVIEMGMNHKGEISQLSKMVKPNKAIITNIGSSHIGNLKNEKDIYQAKMEITDGLDGELIVNGDDKYLKKCHGFKCGCDNNNDLVAYNIKIYNHYISFDIYIDQEYQVVFPIPSKYYIQPLLEAIKIGLDYHIDISDILRIIRQFKPVDGRLKIIPLRKYTIVDDAYNANYESIKCGLNTLKNISKHKIIILGDMLELGKYSKKYHRKLNKILKKIDNKQVITVGNDTKYIKSIHFSSNDEVIKYLQKINLDNTYIYLKASHGMHLDHIIKWLKKLSN